jgi:hypothetical protein
MYALTSTDADFFASDRSTVRVRVELSLSPSPAIHSWVPLAGLGYFTVCLESGRSTLVASGSEPLSPAGPSLLVCFLVSADTSS